MYSIVISVHLATLAVLVPLILYTDHLAVKWFLGYTDTLPERRMRSLHRVIGGGLVLMIASGAVLFSSVSAYLLISTAFLVKVGFVAVLVVNSVCIGFLMRIAFTTPFKDVPSGTQTYLLLSGVVSSGSWIGAVIAALNLGL